MIQKACPFAEEWYDWTTEKILDFIDANSGNNFVYIEFSYLDLGKDEKWLKQQIKELGGDMLIVKRELLLEWTYASNNSPFTEEQLSKAQSYVLTNMYSKIFLGNYQIYVIEQPNNMLYKNYILSIDISGGLGRDYSTFSLIDPSDMRTKMVFFNNLISITNFANFVIQFVQTYVPNAIIIPERNNAGLAFIEIIQKSVVSKNLYYEMKNDKTIEVVDREKSIFKPQKVKKETRIYGLNTTGKTRDIMINEILYMIMDERPDLVNHKFLFDEIKSLIRNSRNKIEHQASSHDDIMFSYLIGLYILLYGKNTNRFLKNLSDWEDTEDKTPQLTKTNLKTKAIFDTNSIRYDEAEANKMMELMKKQQELNDALKSNDDLSYDERQASIKAKRIKSIFNYNSK